MKSIELTQGQRAIIDDDDYEKLAVFKWQARKISGLWYATRMARVNGKKTNFAMHRVILNAPTGQDVDHINGNGLDNQKRNLRLVGDSENQQNRHRWPLNTSGYRGVTRIEKWNKWQAGIKRFGKSYHLGWHDTAEGAARAYDAKAREIYGPRALVNFPETSDALSA